MSAYKTGAPFYLDAGWAGVLPLPPKKKSPPPTGYTGWNGKDPSSKMIETWCNETVGDFQAASNIAIHAPDGVVGIDVDHYGEKLGGETLAKLEGELGALPPTHISTARNDGISGVRWFRVEPGLRWPTGPGKDIEFIHKGHRYAVVWPSIHPDTGDRYIWVDQHSGDESPPPNEDELAWMPDEWQLRFTGGLLREDQPEYRAATEAERAQCLTEGEPCKATSSALAKYQDRAVASARHDSMIKTVMALVRLGEQGHRGVMTALKAMHNQFTADVAPDRRDGSEQSEFQRAVNGAVAKVTATPTPDDKKGCCGQSEPPVEPKPEWKPIKLEQAHKVFKRWLGDDYDLGTLDAMLAAAAVERLDGDPLWLLIVSGSGNAKTETVQALSSIGALVVSAVTSEGALLSATSKRDRSKSATGGLLREIGDRGVLVIKDFTSILSMNRDMRAQVLGALREVHDGSWVRKVGSDGGQSLPWSGRIAIIGAVTTAWDTHHAVVAAMGDRFVLARADSTKNRQAAGRQAIGNTGSEIQMRAELAQAVGGVIAGMDTTPITTTAEEGDALLAAADLVTLARTAVERDYTGNVIDAHAPEMPTRFAKELVQIVRGAVAIGMDRHDALRLAIRCARDSMPPLRLQIIDDVAAHRDGLVADVRRRLGKPHNTVDREVQALYMLGVLKCDEVSEFTEKTGKWASKWHYSLADGINPTAIDLKAFPEKSVSTPSPQEEGREEGHQDNDSPCVLTDKSGNGSESPPPLPQPAEHQSDTPIALVDYCACGKPLLAPRSRQRGICESCWLHNEDGAA